MHVAAKQNISLIRCLKKNEYKANTFYITKHLNLNSSLPIFRIMSHLRESEFSFRL